MPDTITVTRDALESLLNGCAVDAEIPQVAKDNLAKLAHDIPAVAFGDSPVNGISDPADAYINAYGEDSSFDEDPFWPMSYTGALAERLVNDLGEDEVFSRTGVLSVSDAPEAKTAL